MMYYISANNLSFCLPDGESLFNNLNFTITNKSKTALIGKNGIGKSTLFKILLNMANPSAGVVKSNAKISYLPQKTGDLIGSLADVIYDTGYTNDYWKLESEARKELSRFGLNDVEFDRDIRSFSGGEITKILLVKTFISDSDIIFFDEPTNNLDRSSKNYFYEWVRATDKGLFIISHDRELLNKIEIIYELTEKGLQMYSGGYGYYVSEKRAYNARLNNQLTSLENEEKLIIKKQQKLSENAAKKKRIGLKNINRNKYTRAGAGQKRMQAESSAGKKSKTSDKIHSEVNDRLKELKNKIEDRKSIKINLSANSTNQSKILFSGSDMCFSYGRGVVFERINIDIRYGERLIINGDNGSGKTTLLKLITGEYSPLRGGAVLNTKPVYLDQKLELLDGSKSILDNYCDYNPDDSINKAYDSLARVLFRNENVLKLVSTISGGELLKATLACVLANPNLELLILDEPTNNLDIDSVNILEESLQSYKGALILVSHDQSLIDKVNFTSVINL